MEKYCIRGRFFAFAAGLLGFALCRLHGQPAQLTLGPQTLQPDGTTQVPVSIASGGSSIAAVQFDVSFYNSILPLPAVPASSATGGNKTVYEATRGFRKRYLVAG